VIVCRVCGEPFAPAKPWFWACPSCFAELPRVKPSATAQLAQRANQLSLTDTPEWQDATSPYLAYEDARRSAA
jgi:hypothetical protein